MEWKYEDQQAQGLTYNKVLDRDDRGDVPLASCLTAVCLRSLFLVDSTSIIPCGEKVAR